MDRPIGQIQTLMRSAPSPNSKNKKPKLILTDLRAGQFPPGTRAVAPSRRQTLNGPIRGQEVERRCLSPPGKHVLAQRSDVSEWRQGRWLGPNRLDPTARKTKSPENLIPLTITV